MSILDRFRTAKTRNKRTKEEIQHFNVLTSNQKKIIDSYKARALASEMESKILRSTLFSLDNMSAELGIDAFENQNQSSIMSNGQFNFSDLIIKVLGGIDKSQVPGGKTTLSGISDFVSSQSQEINSLASHQIQNIVKSQKDKQVITQ